MFGSQADKVTSSRPSLPRTEQYSSHFNQSIAMAEVSLEDFISEKLSALKLEIPADDVSFTA